jgi:hypothetical protein
MDVEFINRLDSYVSRTFADRQEAALASIIQDFRDMFAGMPEDARYAVLHASGGRAIVKPLSDEPEQELREAMTAQYNPIALTAIANNADGSPGRQVHYILPPGEVTKEEIENWALNVINTFMSIGLEHPHSTPVMINFRTPDF